jgi:hypothetical protein
MIGGSRVPTVPSRWRCTIRTTAAVAVSAIVGVALVACGTEGGSGVGSAEADRCEVLLTATPTLASTELDADAPTGSVASSLDALFGAVEGAPARVVIYLEPSLGERELDELARAVARERGVDVLATNDRDATYADFRRLFADQESMLANVEPEDLPLSAVLRVDADEVSGLRAWAEARTGTYEVRVADPSVVGAELSAAFVARADRDRWAAVADAIERTEGRPEWATSGALLLRAALDGGLDRALSTPQITSTIVGATASLDADRAACD